MKVYPKVILAKPIDLERAGLLRTARRKGAYAQIDLRKLRRWFAEADPPNPDPPAPNPNPEAADRQAAEKLRRMLNDLQKERARRRQAEERLSALEAQFEAEKQQRQEAAGEWKELYEGERQKNEGLRSQITELGAKAARLETLEAVISESNAKMLENIPQEKRALLPIEQLQPEVVYELLPQWQQEYAPPAPVRIGEGDGTPGLNGRGGKSKLTRDQRAAFDMGVAAGVWKAGDEEKYLASLERLGSSGNIFPSPRPILDEPEDDLVPDY